MSWKQFELAPANSAFNGSKAASVSRIPNSMEVWWIGANGSVQDAYWYDGGQWGRFELAPAGSAAPNGGITAVSRIPGSMEVWWIGANGSVQGAFCYEGGQWGHYELAPAGSASTSGGIKAVSRIPNSMEVWWTGANSSIQDAYWYVENIPTILDFDFNPIVFDGGVPVGGSSHLTIRQDGSFTFSGHFHDSGATAYNVALVWAVKDFQNHVYTFQHLGHVSGTFESGSRDDDWRIDSRDDRIVKNWIYLAAGSNATAKASANIDLVNLTSSLIGALGTVLRVVAIF